MLGFAAAEEGSYPDAGFFVGNCDDCILIDRLMAIQACLDLPQLDAISAPFDHAVAASQIRVIAVGRLDNDITGLVPAASGSVLVKGARRLVGERPVALHYAAAGDQELSLFAAANVAPVGLHDSSLQMRGDLADVFADQHQRRSVLEGDVNIENRKIEMKRGV